MGREDVEFTSDGTRCAAWLYRPDGADEPVPCIVIAHGWSCVRDQRLDAYGERFAAAGFAALVFDYRHFGDSDGEPRQLLDIRRQLGDWQTAVACARGFDGIDPDRIALWGSSFSGGHVMHIAARDSRVAAVVAQVPFADGLMNLRSLGVGHSLKLTANGLRDQAGALAGRPPHMLAAVGPPGSTSVMSTPDADPGMRALLPSVSTWRNETAARVVLRVSLYRPGRDAAKIACPILFAIADDDAITPPQYAHDAAARAPHAEVKTYPVGHFDPYVGEWFEHCVGDQIEFFQHHLARKV